MVRTSPSQGGNPGSTPGRATDFGDIIPIMKKIHFLFAIIYIIFTFYWHSLAPYDFKYGLSDYLLIFCLVISIGTHCILGFIKTKGITEKSLIYLTLVNAVVCVIITIFSFTPVCTDIIYPCLDFVGKLFYLPLVILFISTILGLISLFKKIEVVNT